jgi:hypothetical protein
LVYLTYKVKGNIKEKTMKHEITIRRPNGNIEKVITEKFGSLNYNLWNQMIIATRKAGRGECLSYRKIEEKRVYNPNEKAKCSSCCCWGIAKDMEKRGIDFYHRGCTN